jgi:hypothetical protein
LTISTSARPRRPQAPPADAADALRRAASAVGPAAPPAGRPHSSRSPDRPRAPATTNGAARLAAAGGGFVGGGVYGGYGCGEAGGGVEARLGELQRCMALVMRRLGVGDAPSNLHLIYT